MKRMPFLTVLALVVTFIYSCQTTEIETPREVYLDLPATPYRYKSEVVNDAVPTLGRVLFYDRQLSINNSLSCASCHKQSLAFADNVSFSKGFESVLTTRNSMPIQNLEHNVLANPISSFVDPIFNKQNTTQFNPLAGTLFWDGRERVLSKMVLRPIVNHIEMGISDLEGLNQKLESIPYYSTLFTKAFGTTDITTSRIGEALDAFLVNITSNETRLDKSKLGKETLNALELQGMGLFTSKYDCNNCHQVQSSSGYLFFGGGFANIGLEEQYKDNGLALVTKRPSDDGKFKIPSLRNVALTAPYMHDGRFANLEEVLDHYSEGIANHPNLDFRLRGNGGMARDMNISQQERKAIIAFLHTLTDHNMITDVRFSDPFKAK